MLLRVVLFLAVSIAAWAQADANKGQILGVVSDPNGAVVPNATVTIKNTGTGFTRELKTDAEGQYRAVLLDPGTYDVAAQSSGFAATTLSGLVLSVGGAVTANITLSIQGTVTTVEVGETLIQVALPQPTTNLNATAIANLPILGRRFHDFAVLTPTVQVDPQRGQLSFAGQRGIYSNAMLDGTDYNQPFFGGIRGGERSVFAFTIPQSAIQEFQVVTTGYSAEYGRSTGGVLNAITKSGSNSVNGELFYQVRHKEMGLKNPILNVAPNETLQQFGGGAGGPIVRDRWFWFGALEQQYSRIPRRIFFPLLTASTPNSREGFDFLRSQEESFRQTNDATVATARTDYQFAAGHRLAIRYNFSNNNAQNAVSVGGALNPLSTSALSNEGIEKNRTHTGTVQYTHLFSPTVINDTRFSTTYEVRPRESNSELPLVIVGPVGRFGATNFLPTVQDDTRVQIVNSTTLSAGDHTFKLGVDYSRLKTFQAFGFNQFGQFNIAGNNVERLLDIISVGGTVPNRFGAADVTYSRQIGNLLADFGMHQLAMYAQDSWRVRSNLTFDLGFRWEGQWNPQPEATNTDLVNRVRNATYPVGLPLDPTRIPDALKQFMPRFGFAYNPEIGGKRVVVRGHTGLFYAATPMIIFAGHTNNFRQVPGNLSINLPIPGTQGTVYDQLLAAGVDLNRSPLGQLPVIPIDVVQRAASLALGGGSRDPFIGAGLDIVATDFRNPRAYQAGIGVESELFSNFVAGIQLTYVNTVNLMRNRDYNLPAPIVRDNDPSRRPFYGLRSGRARPIPTLGAFTVRESSAKSMYRGATFQAQYRVRRFQFQTNYTLAEAFSDSDLERDAGGVDFEDAFNFRPDYNYSRIDARHQFNANTVVTLPLGFEASAIFRARSGYPLNAITGADTNEDLFTTNDRPYSAPGVPFERNSFRNRGFATLDTRFLKNFRFGDVRRLQFSVEIFNLTNRDNVVFNSPTGGGAVTNFGPGLGAAVNPLFQSLRRADGSYNPATTVQLGNPLQAQFGLRFFF